MVGGCFEGEQASNISECYFSKPPFLKPYFMLPGLLESVLFSLFTLFYSVLFVLASLMS